MANDKPKKNAEAPAPAPTAAPVPIPMVLYCQACGEQHIDAPEPPREGLPNGWDNPPHRTHKCGSCQKEWRPADVCTVGVLIIETAGQNQGAPLARAIPASGLEMHNLRAAVLELRRLIQAGDTGAALESANRLALLAGLPYTELPR